MSRGGRESGEKSKEERRRRRRVVVGMRKGEKRRGGIGTSRGGCRRAGRADGRLKGIGGSGPFGRAGGGVQTFNKYAVESLEQGKESKVKTGKHIRGGVQKEDDNTDSTV